MVGRAEQQPDCAGSHQVGAEGDLSKDSSAHSHSLLSCAHAAALGLEGCHRVLEGELQGEPSGSV